MATEVRRNNYSLTPVTPETTSAAQSLTIPSAASLDLHYARGWRKQKKTPETVIKISCSRQSHLFALMQLTQRSRHQAQQRKACYAVSVFVQALLAREEKWIQEWNSDWILDCSKNENMPKTFENKQFQFFLQRLTLQLLFHTNLLKMQNPTMTSETHSWCNLDM